MDAVGAKVLGGLIDRASIVHDMAGQKRGHRRRCRRDVVSPESDIFYARSLFALVNPAIFRCSILRSHRCASRPIVPECTIKAESLLNVSSIRAERTNGTSQKIRPHVSFFVCAYVFAFETNFTTYSTHISMILITY